MEKKVIRIPTNLNDFFKCWFIFLSPLHNLTNRELDVAAEFLKKRYELSKSIINNDDLLESTLMNEATKREIRENCNLSATHFQVIMGKLRKARIIENNRINPKYIPNLKEDKGVIQLVILFDINE
jgi:hypothetical protein